MRVACIWLLENGPTEKLADLFLRYSPQICVRGERAIFIEIEKCRKLYSEETFLARARIILMRARQKAVIRIGRDLTDALTLAQHEKYDVNDLPLASLVDFVDPFMRDVVLQKSIHQLILTFRDLGIKTIGDFKKISAPQLVSRFGVVGRFCYNRVHFQDFINWPIWTPIEVIEEKKEFPYFEFYGELEPILFELKNQLDMIFSRIFARGLRLTRLQIKVLCEKNSAHPNSIRTLDFDFFVPQSAVKGTLRIVKERLTREFERRPILSPIEGLHTRVMKTTPINSSQKNIFNNDEEKFEQIYSIHNQLVELFGKENIFQAQLTQDRRPERSWVKQFDSPHQENAVSPDFFERLPERTTYLFRHPVKVEIRAGFIFINSKRYRILRWDNQIEKISGAWYEKPDSEIRNVFDRSYYNVELDNHQRISVFQTPERSYYMHGYYG